MSRTGRISRSTKETSVDVEVELDNYNEPRIDTSVPFFDHMLEQLGKHSGIAVRVESDGDTEVDSHHLVEDVGITLGKAFDEALGDRKGIRRYASITLPFDEVLVRVSLDISGRGYLDYGLPIDGDVEGFPLEVVPEFFRGFTVQSGSTLHIDLLKEGNRHHMLEAVFKAVARVYRQGVAQVDSSIPSTKGTLDS
ncbi:MAG: imidazoleglycerol-phosphate dehydratase HisB [bacterium]